MKSLIAITTCHKFKARADAIRTTWAKEIQGIDYKFFLGNGSDRLPGADEVFLDVPDDYVGLSWKTRAIMKWAVEHDYDTVFKCDDDTFVFPERLLNSFLGTPYEGRVNNSSKELAAGGWCSGFAYWLSGKALRIIANAPEPIHKAEDVWVGMILNKHRIIPTKQPGFLVLSLMSSFLWYQYRNQVVATCEFPEGKMLEINKVMRKVLPYRDPDSNPMNPKSGVRVARFGEVLRR